MNPFLSTDAAHSDEWQTRANCRGKPVELFEYQEKDSPLAKDMKMRARIAFNYANFELAAEICIECPVFFQCGENATPEDKYWTVRQGEPPGRFELEAEHLSRLGRPTSGPGEPRVCQRGHFLPTGGRCNQCKLDRMKEKRDAKRAAQQAADAVE